MTSNSNTNSKIFTANLPITNPSLNGAVVGKGASNLKRMALEAGGGFRVQLLNSKKPGEKKTKFSECDTFRVTANSKDALKKGAMILKSELQKLAMEKQQHEKQYKKVVKVEKENVGKVIGKGGETVKAISKKAQVRVEYKEDMGGFVVTGGKQEALNHAEVLILGELKKKTEKKTDKKEIQGGFKLLENADEVLNNSKSGSGKVELGFMFDSKINSLKNERTEKFKVREQIAKSKGVLDWEVKWPEVDAEITKRNMANAEIAKIKSEKLAGMENEKKRVKLSEDGSFPGFGKVVEKKTMGMWGNGASEAVMSERKKKPEVIEEKKPKMSVLTMGGKSEEEEVVIDGWVVDDNQANEFCGGGLGESLMRNVDAEAMEQEQVDFDDMFAGEDDDEEEEVVIDDWDM
mgnify:FL=1